MNSPDLHHSRMGCLKRAPTTYTYTSPHHVHTSPFHLPTLRGSLQRRYNTAIITNPARFPGLDGTIGSIEAGRAATLFICSGDILEITSRVERAFIDGREIDLNDKQKMLYEKYRTKYRQMGLIE